MSQISSAGAARSAMPGAFDDPPGFPERGSRRRSDSAPVDPFDTQEFMNEPSLELDKKPVRRGSVRDKATGMASEDDGLVADEEALYEAGADEHAEADVRAGAASFGSIWRWALLASFLWVSAVVAFYLGAYRVSLVGGGPLSNDLASIDQYVWVMAAGVAFGPLALIGMAAIVTRQAMALRRETRFLQEAVDRLSERMASTPAPGQSQSGIAFTSGQDAHALKREADDAIAALKQVEESFISAQGRARTAREAAEVDSYAVKQLLQDGEQGQGAANREAQLAELASLVANALTASGVVQAAGAAPSMSMAPPPSPRPSPPPFGSSKEALQEASPREGLNRGFEEAEQTLQDLGGAKPPPPAAVEPEEAGLEPVSAAKQAMEELSQRGADAVREEAPPSPEPRNEGAGPLSTRPAAEGDSDGVDWAKFVKAANFPDSEDDRETLDALYAVLSDRDAAGLLQAAEDTLSGLADIGLFMEDMIPHHAPAEVWRRYIVENEAAEAMELGGVRDAHAIEDVIAALNDKPDFASTSDKFLKRYEDIIARMFNEGQDAELVVQLADSRSGRAYMLLGRSSGRFG